MSKVTDAYREMVVDLACRKTDQRILNGLPEHATALVETAFTYAESTVRIYSGELNDKVFGKPGVIKAARRFLKRPNAELNILLQEPVSGSCAFLRGVGAERGVNVRIAGGVYATGDAKHFTVVDKTGYRFETDHKKTEAIANFNEPETATVLANVFDEVFEAGTSLA